MAKASTVLLLVLLVTTAAMVLASVADVNIYNEIEGEEIQVNCKKSGKQYFGEKTLRYGEHFGWGFMPNMWGTTKYSCSFRWGVKVQNFYVWYDDGYGIMILRPCQHCVYTVTKDGFYRNEKSRQKKVFIYTWR